MELFGYVFLLSCCPFDISVGMRAFVIGLSQIFSFFHEMRIVRTFVQLWYRMGCRFITFLIYNICYGVFVSVGLEYQGF